MWFDSCKRPSLVSDFSLQILGGRLYATGSLTVILIFLDEDECSTGMAACGLYASCKDTSNYYKCSCPHGFLMGEARKEDCQDIDECKGNENKCHEDAVCKNTIGSYTCQCKNGFKGNGRFCSDINECKNSANQVLYYNKRTNNHPYFGKLSHFFLTSTDFPALLLHLLHKTV